MGAIGDKVDIFAPWGEIVTVTITWIAPHYIYNGEIKLMYQASVVIGNTEHIFSFFEESIIPWRICK